MSGGIAQGCRWAAVCVAAICGAAFAAGGQEAATWHLTPRADADGSSVPCRVHLRDAAGDPVLPEGYPSFRDHITVPGAVAITLPPGGYTYEIERGPEYAPATGSLSLGANQAVETDVVLERFADMAVEGWYSGDLHIHRPPGDIALLMRAEDLAVAPVITWWNARNLWTDRALPDEPLVTVDGRHFAHIMAGEDERNGGAFLFFGRSAPLAIAGAEKEWPSPLVYLEQAKAEGVWIDIEKPFWWDVPVAVAHGLGDSIGLANNHMCRSSMYESEAWGKPRDTDRLPPPRGNGFWSQEIYYHLLNAGIRIPPSAGSASGVLPNPVGYNRVYVHLEGPLSHAAWWDGLRAGRSFVTNGPLLRVTANGARPGEVFRAQSGPVAIAIEARLDARDPIPAIEIVQNGAVARRVPWDPSDNAIDLGTLEFTESGWFLVRAIAEVPHTFRFASTAPYYVEIGPEPQRISRKSAQFFLDWVEERIGRIDISDASKRAEVMAYHDAAATFWMQRVAEANVE